MADLLHLAGRRGGRGRGRRLSFMSEAQTSMANNDRLPPIHPGEILREEFLSPLGLSAHQLALALRVPATRINDIVNEKRGITADTGSISGKQAKEVYSSIAGTNRTPEEVVAELEE